MERQSHKQISGPAFLKNPLISVHLATSKSGDTVMVSWVDNMGESDSVEKNGIRNWFACAWAVRP